MMSVQTTLFSYKNVLHVYLPLSSSPGMTISYFCHDAKRGWGRGPRYNVIMMLIFLQIVWKCPLRHHCTIICYTTNLKIVFKSSDAVQPTKDREQKVNCVERNNFLFAPPSKINQDHENCMLEQLSMYTLSLPSEGSR